MNPFHGSVLRGSWSPGINVAQTDDMGGGNVATILGDKAAVSLEIPRPGLHPLYYGVAGQYLHWDEREWPLHRKLRGLGVKKPMVHLVEGGSTVRFNGRTLRVSHDMVTAPPNHYPADMAAAQTQFASRLLYVVEDLYKAHGRGPVYLLLSGGVDSIAIAWALKHIGADVLCLTCGRTEDDFDPAWARKTAEHLQLPWDFVRLPTDSTELQALLEQTLLHIEQTSFSNVLMGLCVELIRARARAAGRHVGYMGFWGDLLFGHKLQVTGSFNLLPEAEKNDRNWTAQRISTCWKSKPHTLQLAKGLRAAGDGTWRVPFLHKELAAWTFGLPQTFAPPKMDKPLLYGLMERYLPSSVCAWHEQKKIGFYTGAGAGKIRLKNPVLQDPNIRATYAALKQRHT